jgi:hypothetical protein
VDKVRPATTDCDLRVDIANPPNGKPCLPHASGWQFPRCSRFVQDLFPAGCRNTGMLDGATDIPSGRLVVTQAVPSAAMCQAGAGCRDASRVAVVLWTRSA